MEEISEGHYRWTRHPDSLEEADALLELEFTQDSAHPMDDNFFVLRVKMIANYGRYSGKIRTADGQTIVFSEKFGFFEDMHSQW
mmetsp:Transcript_583/g.597  ORF Transcript_583/g.597 Transcript_583/m.597 type:complete len:84 (+) Transcript_583:318-569(+)